MSSRMPWLILLTLAWRAVAHVPNGYLATRQDSPLLVFAGILELELTSCAPASFDWVYTGPDGSLFLFLTHIDDATRSRGPLPTFTDGSNSNPRSLYRRDEFSVQIASSISPRAEQFNLTSLSVPSGKYFLVANLTSIFPPYTTNSSVFTVREGDNTSCLSSSSTSSLTSSASTLSPSAVSSDLASITSGDVSSTSTSPTVVAVGGVSSTPVNKGAIAGGVVAGAVVLIAAAVFYFFFVVYPRRSRAHSRAPGGPHGHAPAKGNFGIGAPAGRDEGGRWGGLASVDSHLPPSDSKAQRPYVNTRRQSNGAGVSQDDINSYLSRSGSVNYGGYGGSPSEEKFSSSPSEEMVLAALPYRGPDSNVHAPNNNVRSYSASPISSSEHRYSQSHAWRSSLDSSSINAQTLVASPPASSPLSLAHTSLTGAQTSPRKTARKPVPAYDESPDVPAKSFMTPSPSAPATTPFADPVLPYPAPVSSGHYSTRAERESLKSLSSKSKLKTRKDKSNTSSTNASSEEIAQQELVHKNSFGPGGVEGKQLHYLIPDMPVGHR